MPVDDRILLLSLRPRFAEMLLAGKKTIELRRSAPDVKPGTPALLYASSPVQALVGTAVVNDIVSSTTSEIWRRFAARTGLSREEYDAYFDGAGAAVAIMLGSLAPLPQPVSLADLRTGTAWFRPPQSFRYLSSEQVGSLGLAIGANGRRARGRQLQIPEFVPLAAT